MFLSRQKRIVFIGLFVLLLRKTHSQHFHMQDFASIQVISSWAMWLHHWKWKIHVFSMVFFMRNVQWVLTNPVMTRNSVIVGFIFYLCQFLVNYGTLLSSHSASLSFCFFRSSWNGQFHNNYRNGQPKHVKQWRFWFLFLFVWRR